ncbi:MAG: cob(I)yrinic acid a,c-diamide adenosyltransferase [Flavobacteriales bacterium]|nr:cob(I)yrinic acid a,c-diamide adenosyltransferase [Flavobacteriales bacterium]MBL6872932.1 cob(I)yrinic acid a,c-diamide adenosyltransferase [Flavobacteriales bacterium]
MKVYTKKGDKGTTQLIGGKRVPKNHERIDAYGTVDELNSYMGLLRDQSVDKETQELIITIQNKLFTIGALLANQDGNNKMKLPFIDEKDVSQLENEIDKMNGSLPEMRSFILPGGHTTVSFCHIARCVCRRAERLTIQIGEDVLQFEIILKYLNRLSDYLFVLSRYLSKNLNAKEIPWISGK